MRRWFHMWCLVCFRSLLLLVPLECCASWLWYFLGIFTYIFVLHHSVCWRFKMRCLDLTTLKNISLWRFMIVRCTFSEIVLYGWFCQNISKLQKKVREKSRECHNHKPQPFPDPKRKRKPTNPNKHKSNKRTKSTKISSLFPKRGNRNTKRTEKRKNKMTHGKIYNKPPRRINHKATKSKTNTGTTALERSVEQTTGGLKHFYS